MTIRLILTEVGLLLLFACSPSKNIADNQMAPKSFVSVAEGLAYRASFSYKEHHFSGIMAIKAQGVDIYVVLMSELGPTIMSFKLTPHELEVIDMIDLPQNKMLLKQLEADLRLMLLAGLHQNEKVSEKKRRSDFDKFRISGKNHITVLAKTGNNQYSAAKRTGVACDKVTVGYDYTDGSKIPTIITMKHSMFNIRIKLVLLD